MSTGKIALICFMASVPLIADVAVATERTLAAYASDEEVVGALKKWKQAGEQERPVASVAPAPPAQSYASGLANESASLDRVMVTGSRIAPADVVSITNNQSSGVDEGDIVKSTGEFLIVLRRGRLFSIRIGDDQLQAVSAVNSYAPDANPDDTWYDEILVTDDKVVVIGYSYDRGGTEIGIFDLDPNGKLHYRDTYQMRSNDYYSAGNYASRLIGQKLIFYAPIDIDEQRMETLEFLPALRHWRHAGTPADFKRILPATRIYRGGTELDPQEDLVLHSVSVCDLETPVLDCQSNAILGPEGRVFYVLHDLVYVWTTPWSLDPRKPNSSAVFRMPLDGTAPSGLRTSGSPIDQMSFLERDGYLNVLVGSEADGEGMWASASRAGELALLRIHLDELGDGNSIAAGSDYRPLPSASDEDMFVQSRFIGDWLVYGAGEPWRSSSHAPVAHALKYATNEAITTLHPGYYVDRIDALGEDAILIGSYGEDLHFSSLRLDSKPVLASRYIQPNADQGDDRTHGFFYKSDEKDTGRVGLPVMRFGSEGEDATAAAVLYLRNHALKLKRMGSLESHAEPGVDDGCKASCVDWYGNARPIFIGERVFALLGYELVEGISADERITERRRVDFAP